MPSTLPCRRVAARLSLAALVSSALLVPCLPALAQASATPSPFAVTDPGSAHTLLTRLAPQPMGANNAVRLWLRGDGSGATVRVRLFAADPTGTAADAAVSAPAWLSEPLVITWTGWREVLLPESKFSRRGAALPAGSNAALPADDQPDMTPAAAPAWADISAIGLEMETSKRALLGVDDITWVTVDADGAAKSGTPVDDFEQGDVAAWQSTGSAMQQQMLTYGLATAPALVHGGRIAFQMTVTAPAVSRAAALVSARKLLAQTGKTYLVWTPANRFDTVLPTSLPPAGGANSDLTVQAAPDQILGIGVCLYSAKPLTNVSVATPAALLGIGRALKAPAGQPPLLDVRVVKVQEEPGGGLLRDDSFADMTPDLLVKNDEVALSGTTPVIRLTGDPVTDIPADTAKEFWITISVPRNSLPGVYNGRLMISGRGLAAPVPIPISLTVLGMQLASGPSKQYAINLRSSLDPAPATLPSADGRNYVTDYVSKDMLDRQLADIAAHGFHISTLYDSPATLWDALAEYQANGMYAPYVYKGDGDPRAVEATRVARGGPAFLYFVDPTDPDAAAREKALGKSGIAFTTYITRLSDFTAIASADSVPIYSRDCDYGQLLVRTKGGRKSNNMDWWYWPAAQEDPVATRVACGWALVRANLYGAFLPDYQTAFGTDPYDLTSAGAAPDKAALRSQMLTYPVQGGVLDTLRWEAAREGVTDVRYLTTMYDALRQCKDAKIAKPLTDKTEAFVKAFLDKSPELLTDADMDHARAQVAAYTLSLRSALGGYNKAHHLPVSQ